MGAGESQKFILDDGTELTAEEAAPERKLGLAPEMEAARADAGDPASLTAIVRVSEAGYVPDGVELRARISDELFTAQVSGEALEGLLADPRVVSVSPAQRLPTVDG